MKCTGISLGNEHPKDSRTMEQFIGSEQAQSPLGKLLLALTEEKAWSSEYTVYASFDETPFLQIKQKTFLPERSLMIYDDSKVVLSIRGVEDAVRAHLNDSKESLLPAISILQSQANNLLRASEQIAVNKSRAVIVATFPEATGATLNYYGAQRDLYSFSLDPGRAPSFVAREINYEFVGGVTRVGYNSFEWYRAGDGIEANQRHGIFWTALAIAFAARELQTPEDCFYCQKVFAEEKPFLWPQPAGYDPYIVKEVLLRIRHIGKGIYVKFGADNLPAMVVQVPDEEMVES